MVLEVWLTLCDLAPVGIRPALSALVSHFSLSQCFVPRRNASHFSFELMSVRGPYQRSTIFHEVWFYA